MRPNEKDAHKKIGHEHTFRPALNARKYKFKAPYSHHAEFVEVKKEHRDSSGRVKLGLPNFYTSGRKLGRPGTGVGTSFGHFEYMPPYDFKNDGSNNLKTKDS